MAPKFSPTMRTSGVVKSVFDFERLLQRERQFNLLRTINELPRAGNMKWLTVCRIAGLTEIEIKLLNDLLQDAPQKKPRRAA